jgi:hypothetical protein
MELFDLAVVVLLVHGGLPGRKPFLTVMVVLVGL